jgi:hypothetical protein
MPKNVTASVVATLSKAVVASGDSDVAEPAPASRYVDLPVALVVLACAWWLIAVPRMWGGRDTGAVSIGAFLTLLAIVAIRPQRYLPARFVMFALAISIGALGAAQLSPTGWAGASTGASYVAVSWTAVAVASATVRDHHVVNVLLGLLAVGVLVEIAESWLAWWGGANASRPLIGTFYWHDPFAAFLLAGTMVGFVFWLRCGGAIAALGLATFTFGTIGIVYSTSRATGACFAAAFLLVLAAHLFHRRRHGIWRAGGGAVVTAFCTWAIAGPPFFPHRSLPFAATAARGAGQSLSQNGSYRLEFWHEAMSVFTHHPIVGGGYHSLAVESAGHVPAGWALSPLAHNGYLQALSDGGMLLGVPFLLAVAGVCWWVVASLSSAVRNHDFSLVRFVVPLCLGALLVHSGVDFDWSYAADFAVVAILVGMLGGARAIERGREPSSGSSRVLAVGVALGLILLAVSGVAAWHGDIRQSLPIVQAAGQWGTQ